MLTLPNQHPIYLIMDALDECPNTPGIPPPRERVLRLVKELAEICVPNLRICVMSRPEIDIRKVLEPLTSRRVSLHDQSGQKEDIADCQVYCLFEFKANYGEMENGGQGTCD
jgi:hypothetical protein